MLEGERIFAEVCGCHVDRLTGLVTAWCLRHEPRPRRFSPDLLCAECDADIYGPPLLDAEALYWTGWSLSWCSTGCLDRSAERYWTNRR